MRIVAVPYMMLGVLLLLLAFPSDGMARKRTSPSFDRPQLPDSIFRLMSSKALSYDTLVSEFTAELYMKSTVNVRKKNLLLQLVPAMFKMQKGVSEYISEGISTVHYTAPRIYDVKAHALYGTFFHSSELSPRINEFFNMNIYSSSFLRDRLLSPLASNGWKYYYYLLDSAYAASPSGGCYRIRVVPRMKSEQLLEGFLTVDTATWSIRRLDLKGKVEFTRFRLRLETGVSPDEYLLPKRLFVDFSFRFFGNRLDGTHFGVFTYQDIVHSDTVPPLPRRSKYDLTESFSLSLDSAIVFPDSSRFAAMRPVPLSPHEDSLYAADAFRRDTLERRVVVPPKRSRVFFGKMGDILLNSYNLDLARFGSFRGSPLISPFLFSYSASNGFSYRQDFRYNCLFPGDRLLRVVPEIGYNFTYKEFYWNAHADFSYLPERRGMVHVEAGNGNRIYSSDVLDELEAVPDSLFDFDQFRLDYFKDLYFSVSHEIEPVNGFDVLVGLKVHRRTLIDKPELPPDGSRNAPSLGNGFLESVQDAYISFAPHVRLRWTPCLYYYMNGRRKMNLRSRYPTMTLDWERGIRGVFGSTSEYERWEFDLQQQIRIGLLRNIYYRVGAGAFTNQRNTYFIDFEYFSRNNLPQGWDDEIGGVFHLLDRRWYNSSDRYLRGHFTFEAPFLLLPHLSRYTGIIRSERLYLNLLFVPRLVPYVEVGYGVATPIFDVGVFASSIHGRFGKIGCKFTFELFN